MLTGHPCGAVRVVIVVSGRVAVDSSREGGIHTVRVLADDVCVDPEGDGWVSVSEPFGDHVDLVQMQNSEEILPVENEELRRLLWTTNRSLPSGLRVNLAAAVRYEHAGGTPTPGYDQLGDAPRP